MRLLLDTHVLLWAGDPFPKLSQAATAMIANDQNTIFFSAASIWEIAIKARLGRADFDVDAIAFRDRLAASGYIELPITSVHCVTAANLAFKHKDPFDRMLLAQAQAENIALVTADALLISFGPPVVAL